MPLPDKRPLEYIELAGYKSIKKLPKFRLNHDLNMLIGANGSGKTNFVRFFELLGHIMDKNKGLQNYSSIHKICNMVEEGYTVYNQNFWQIILHIL